MCSSVVFIGLNPSTADERVDDPTIRRCMAFARSWGYHGVHMLNLFALRATNPREMLMHPEPVGYETDKWIAHYIEQAPLIVAVWGAHGAHLQRDQRVMDSITRDVHCLKLTVSGMPGHPLYLPRHLTPIAFKGAV